MRIVALIPYWDNYYSTKDSMKERSIATLGGESFVSRTIKTLNKVSQIQDVVIFSSNNTILNHVDKNLQFSFLQRNKSLDSNKTSIEDVIESFLLTSDADIVVLIHPKNPFIKSNTIQSCINKVHDLDFDSAFVASSIRKLAWYKGKRLNYLRNSETPSLSEVEPILVESSSVYVFTRDLFNKHRSRIGVKPYIKEIGYFEGFEVERLEDFEVADLIINAGLDKGRI